MTAAAIKRAFGRLDAAEQAVLLRDLLSSLAESLTLDDAHDAKVFAKRRAEEPRARSWDQVRSSLLKSKRRPRARRR